jgi:hypothetical protein
MNDIDLRICFDFYHGKNDIITRVAMRGPDGKLQLCPVDPDKTLSMLNLVKQIYEVDCARAKNWKDTAIPDFRIVIDVVEWAHGPVAGILILTRGSDGRRHESTPADFPDKVDLATEMCAQAMTFLYALDGVSQPEQSPIIGKFAVINGGRDE